MVLMVDAKRYVRSDDHGVWRVGQTRVSLDSVVYAFGQGHAPETIQEQYPALSLEEVYGAIAFYLANKEEVDHYLERQERLWDESRRKTEQNVSPVVDRLRALKTGSVPEKQ